MFLQAGNSFHLNKKGRGRMFNPSDTQGAAILSWIAVPNRDR